MRANDRSGTSSRRCPAASLLKLIVLVGLASLATDTFACSQFGPLPELYVGDTDTNSPTYDAACTHATIQDAIDAATCVYGTKIFITHEHLYTNQHLTIDNKNVTLIGRSNSDVCGPASVVVCNPTCPLITAPLVSIGGQNGSGVFSITGTSNVTLRYLDINNGNNGGANGGGIGYVGSGSLTLDTDWVRANQAVVGGGVYFVGNGATAALLNIQSYTQILANTASDEGGGVFVGGNATLDMIGKHIAVDGNTAAAVGGGIAVIGPATANIGAPDDNGVAAISNNHAEYGGGIAITAPDSDDHTSVVRVFTTDPAQPTSIANNSASHTGGGVWLKPRESGSSSVSNAILCAWDYRIEANQAQEGAAIYADTDSALAEVSGGLVALGGCYPYGAGYEYPVDLGAVACSHNAACSTLNGNIASDNANNPTSTILMQTHAYLFATRFSMRHNVGAHVIRTVGDGAYTPVDISECLIAQNPAVQELIYMGGSGSALSIGACTLVDNPNTASFVIHAESDLALNYDIIDEPDTLAVDFSGDPAKRQLNYLISNDTSTVSDANFLKDGEPDYVDRANGDYHLQPFSLGIDFGPAAGNVDLEGNPRSVDLPLVLDAAGIRDLGPYERQNMFRECGTQTSLFCDGFDH